MRPEESAAQQEAPARPAGRSAARATSEFALATLLFGALALCLLHPLFADPAHSVLDPRGMPWLYGWHRPWNVAAQGEALLRDLKLAIWVYGSAWNGLIEHPFSLFDAGIFHPAPMSLVYTEHALGKLIFFGPIFGATGNPVLAYQLDLWLCFALSGAAMFALLRHFGVGAWAALLAGFVYAFCPARLEMVHYSHLMTGQWLPLAILFLDRTLVKQRVGDALVAALLLALHLLSSVYLAYMGLVVVVAWALASLIAGVGARTGRDVPAKAGASSWRGPALAVAAVGLALVPFVLAALPYLALRSTGTLPNFRLAPAALVPVSLHPWRSLLLPPSWVRGANERLGQGVYAYLGFIPLALAALSLATLRRPVAARLGDAQQALRRVFWVGLLVAFFCWSFALGPELRIAGQTIPLPWRLAMEWIPGFSSMRVPSRFVLGLELGFSLLVGLGADRACMALPGTRWPRAVKAAGVVLLALLVSVEFGLGTTTYKLHRIPVGAERSGVYTAFEAEPIGPLLEIPFAGRGGRYAIDAMVQAVLHRRPLLNGTSGYAPPSLATISGLVAKLPDEASLQVIERLTGLRWVLVHQDLLEPGARLRWQKPTGLREVARDGPDVLYELAPLGRPADLLPSLRECARTGQGCSWPVVEQMLLKGPDRNHDGRIVIVCLGDSNTNAGWQQVNEPTFPRGQGWCERLPRALGEASIEVVNLAVPGASAVAQPLPSVEAEQIHFDGTRQLESALAKEAPDLVLISFVTNDAHPERAVEVGRPRTAAEVVEIHRALLRRAEKAGVPVLVATAPLPRDHPDGRPPRRSTTLVRAINDGLRAALPAEIVLDFESVAAPADYLDDIHVNSAGHERRAAHAAAKIRALWERDAASPPVAATAPSRAGPPG